MVSSHLSCLVEQPLGRNLHKIFHKDLVECMLVYPQETHLCINHIHSVACKYGMCPFVGVSVYTSYLPVAEILLWVLYSDGRSPFNGVA